MTIRDEELIRDKLEFYKNENVAVHLKLKTDSVSIEKPFRNGVVLKLNDNSVIFQDEVLGKVIIYLREILSVDKREAKR